MNFESFGYMRSFCFSPPHSLQSKDGKLLLLATPYGNQDYVIDAMEKFILEFDNLMMDLIRQVLFQSLHVMIPSVTIYMFALSI